MEARTKGLEAANKQLRHLVSHDRPGMLIAEIGHTHSSVMRVGWLSHEGAKKLNALLAVESALTSKSRPPDPDQPAHTSDDEPTI